MRPLAPAVPDWAVFTSLDLSPSRVKTFPRAVSGFEREAPEAWFAYLERKVFMERSERMVRRRESQYFSLMSGSSASSGSKMKDREFRWSFPGILVKGRLPVGVHEETASHAHEGEFVVLEVELGELSVWFCDFEL